MIPLRDETDCDSCHYWELLAHLRQVVVVAGHLLDLSLDESVVFGCTEDSF